MQGPMGRLLMVALALALTGCASSDYVCVEQGTIFVLRVKGMARCSADDKTWVTVKKGTELKPSVLVQTGPKSLVDLCMNDGHPVVPQDGSERTADHIIRIFENSALQINQLTEKQSVEHYSEDIELDLRMGQIMGTIGKLSPESKYEIKLPEGKVMVEGGNYMVSGQMVNVLRGTVIRIKKNADGSESRVEIHAHETFDATTGKVTRLEEFQTKIIFAPNDGLVCGVRPISPTNSPSALEGPRGSGMGGALRKFQ